jgi:molybdenum-dependent DNA-binding transcriptional regulator ModE
MSEHDDFPSLIFRIDFGGGRRLGLGTLMLLEGLARTQSLAEVTRAMAISESRSRELVERLNWLFQEPVILYEASDGHTQRHSLTDFGRTLLDQLRAIDAIVKSAAADQMNVIAGRLRQRGAQAGQGDPSL